MKALNITNSVVSHLFKRAKKCRAGQGRGESQKTIDNTGDLCDNNSRTREKLDILRNIGKDAAISATVTVASIVSETDRYLERLGRSVRENKSVDEASNFCRWLRFSGVLNLPHDDTELLRQKAEAILHRCGQIYRGGVVKPEYAASDIAAILERLDKIVPPTPSSHTVVLAENRELVAATQSAPAV